MTTELRGTGIRLRALQTADQETLRAFVNDPQVLRLSNSYRPISDVQQEAWWRHVTQDAHQVWFGIEDLPTAKLLGTCCLVDIEWISRQAELRIRIGAKEAWGRSLGTEACTLLIGYGFGQLNLERIWLRVAAPHTAALRLYEKLGFAIEGRLRRATVIDGAPEDVVMMALLRDDWRKR